jgi:hypothetical protein
MNANAARAVVIPTKVGIHDLKRSAAFLVLLLSACTGTQPPDWGGLWNTPKPVVASCPPQAMRQAAWVRNNMTRLRLGGSRRDAVTILGLPAHVESFLLTDNSAVDVLFYNTPDTACRASTPDAQGLLPLVFQNDRLLGYGQNYYQNVVVPTLRQPLNLPLNMQVPYAANGGYPTTAPNSVGRGDPLR